MIKHLNVMNFSKYGTILVSQRQKPAFPKENGYIEKILTLRKDSVHLYRLEAERMYLDFEQSMSVLAVSRQPETEPFDYFYLDKPILLPQGTYFALIPMFEQSTVRCSMSSDGRWIPQAAALPETELTISHQLTIQRIYTIFYQDKEKAFFFKGERHSPCELTYIDKGSIHSVVEGVDTVLTQGNMVIFGPEQFHMQYADPDCSASYISISFDIEYPYLHLLLGRKFSLDAEAVNLLSQILDESTHPDMFSDDMILCKLQQVLLIALRMEKPAAEKLRSSASIHNENKIIDDTLAYIAEHIYDRLSVSLVASKNNVSVSYLTALFRTHLHISPGEFIRRARLEESKELIRSGCHNFTETAKLLHYSSIHHFSRQFKEYYGVTPTQYSRSIHFSEAAKGHPDRLK